MTFAEQVKEGLLKIIAEMAKHPEKYCKKPGVDFTRNRKMDFENLLRLMVSMEAGTVRDELMKYFQYDEKTATNSAFFQQRAKLSDDALPILFHGFNDLHPYSLYGNKYHLLAADGSSFTFTRNPEDPDSYFAPDGKTTNGYNQIHIIPLFDLVSKRYTDCVVQPIRKKNEFQALCSLIDAYRAPPGAVPIFIADRGFHAFNVFAHAIENHGFFLIRATDIKMMRLLDKDLPVNQDSFDIEIMRILTRTHSRKKWHSPELSSHYKFVCQNVPFDYIIPGSRDEYQISLRILRFKLPGDAYENIITNLPVKDFPMEEIMKIYNMRWALKTLSEN